MLFSWLGMSHRSQYVALPLTLRGRVCGGKPWTKAPNRLWQKSDSARRNWRTE